MLGGLGLLSTVRQLRGSCSWPKQFGNNKFDKRRAPKLVLSLPTPRVSILVQMPPPIHLVVVVLEVEEGEKDDGGGGDDEVCRYS